MNEGTIMAGFRAQLAAWRQAQDDYVMLREGYRRSWAEAYARSTEKTDTARKAYADAATGEQRLLRDRAEILAASEWQLLLMLRGSVESARQPGQHFGEVA